MSSYEEWFAAEGAGLMPVQVSAFGSQIGWVKALFEILRQLPELFLVSRARPREFPNRRDGAYSYRLLGILQEIPSNCHANWPDQKPSFYDLAKDADAVLNSRSSAGKELALLGLSTVEWAPDFLPYPPEPRYVARHASEYEACVNRALADGWMAERVRRMLRWCALGYGAASFGTAVPTESEARIAQLGRRVLRAVHRRFSPIGADRTLSHRQLDEHVREQLTDAIAAGAKTLVPDRVMPASCLKTESCALVRKVTRLISGLFGAVDWNELGEALKQGLVSLVRGQIVSQPWGAEPVTRRVA